MPINAGVILKSACRAQCFDGAVENMMHIRLVQCTYIHFISVNIAYDYVMSKPKKKFVW